MPQDVGRFALIDLRERFDALATKTVLALSSRSLYEAGVLQRYGLRAPEDMSPDHALAARELDAFVHANGPREVGQRTEPGYGFLAATGIEQTPSGIAYPARVLTFPKYTFKRNKWRMEPSSERSREGTTAIQPTGYVLATPQGLYDAWGFAFATTPDRATAAKSQFRYFLKLGLNENDARKAAEQETSKQWRSEHGNGVFAVCRGFWYAEVGPWDVVANGQPGDAYSNVGAVRARRLRAERAGADAPAIPAALVSASGEEYAALEAVTEPAEEARA